MNYVLITINGTRFLISEKEKISVYQAVANHEKSVIIQRQMIGLQAVPEVLEFPNWFAQENERLSNQRKKLCKKCLGSILIENKCSCSDGVAPLNTFGLSMGEISLKLNGPQPKQIKNNH